MTTFCFLSRSSTHLVKLLSVHELRPHRLSCVRCNFPTKVPAFHNGDINADVIIDVTVMECNHRRGKFTSVIQLLQVFDFSYSCAEGDMMLTDLERRAVPR